MARQQLALSGRHCQVQPPSRPPPPARPLQCVLQPVLLLLLLTASQTRKQPQSQRLRRQELQQTNLLYDSLAASARSLREELRTQLPATTVRLNTSQRLPATMQRQEQVQGQVPALSLRGAM